ncbi:MAG: hypothetical protein COA42_14225 [Alteromonadaceae bacterium]|nr:MAG: hypothetical protein COA42_14225 [Alteromonadaceae bacterium]
MQNKTELTELFSQKLANYQQQRVKLRSIATRVSGLRILSFALAVGGMFYFSDHSILVYASASLLLVFIGLVFKSASLKREIEECRLFEGINQKSLDRQNGKWQDFEDDGREFIDNDHRYSSDLDVFGDNSLFQYMNVARSVSGRARLADGLKEGLAGAEALTLHQQAAKELASKLDWRQRFEVICESLGAKNENLNTLYAWAKQDSQDFTMWQKSMLFLPLITIGSFVLIFVAKVFAYITMWLLLLQGLVFLLHMKKYIDEISVFEDQHGNLKRYANALMHIEHCEVTSELLKSAAGDDNLGASKYVEKLNNVVAFCDIKYSPLVYAAFNIIFLADMQLVYRLRHWQKQHGHAIESWVDAIATFEYAACIAQLHYENPQWCFPKFIEKHQATTAQQSFNAKGLAHPLITEEQRVANDLSALAVGSVTLVTGSNMSGKSTLLRTIGVNVVLANAGGPVCARALNLGHLRLFAAMRSIDSLGDNVSTFFNELNKIKRVFDDLDANATQLILIDEIFSGTNSKDRYVGAVSVIDALMKANAIAVISTHDLAISELESTYSESFRNIHFSDTIDKNGMSFDYSIKEGVASSTNALHLMRLVGIEITDAALAQFEN